MSQLKSLTLSELRHESLKTDLTLPRVDALLHEWQRRGLRAQVPIERLLERWLHLSATRAPSALAAMLRPFRPGQDCNQLARNYCESWTRKWDDGGVPGPRRNRPRTWPWPTTEISRGRGKFNAEFAHEESALHRCGYVVGTAKGMALRDRHRFLNYFFEGPLPAFVERVYGDDYGSPDSEKRLHKMANVIAANCRNFKRIDARRFAVAIESWELDLEYLRVRYYEGWFLFEWPAPAMQVCA